MQSLSVAFLALFLTQLMTDFLLRGDQVLVEKRRGTLRAYLSHGGVHFVAGAALLGLCGSFAWLGNKAWALVLVLTLVHLAIDWANLKLQASHRISDTARTFAIDQLLHTLTIGVGVWWVSGTPMGSLMLALHQLQPRVESTLVLLVVYIGVIFGGGHLIRYLTKPLFKHDLTITGETVNELQDAGLYIGWLERFLVLTALLLRSPAMIGLILAAKSIIRFPELKSVRFAEYFLLGTLLSLSLALVGGLILLQALYGQITVSR